MRLENPKPVDIVFFIVLFVVLFSIQNVFASITRTRTLGDVGIIIKDDANYWLFPSTLIHSSNQAIFELGGRPELVFHSPMDYGFDQWAGGTIRLSNSDQSTLGVFFSETSDKHPFESFTTGSMPANHKLDVFYGRKTTHGTMGVHLARLSGFQSSLRRGSDTKTSLTHTRLDYGFSSVNFDATMGYQLSTFRTKSTDNMGHTFMFRTRVFKRINKKLTLIPLVDLDIGIENKNNGAEQDAVIWNIWTGAGFNYKPNESDLVVIGMSIMRSSTSLKTKESGAKTAVLDLPYVFGGVESELFSWLTIRLGFQKALRRHAKTNEYQNTSVKDVRTTAPFAATVGLGLEYKNFTLDFSWDSDFLRRGPYFLSGSKGDMFNLISMSYRF